MVVIELDFIYCRCFLDFKIFEVYELFILDCLKGDYFNFVCDDEFDVSWCIFIFFFYYLDDNKEIIFMEYLYGMLR